MYAVVLLWSPYPDFQALLSLTSITESLHKDQRAKLKAEFILANCVNGTIAQWLGVPCVIFKDNNK